MKNQKSKVKSQKLVKDKAPLSSSEDSSSVEIATSKQQSEISDRIKKSSVNEPTTMEELLAAEKYELRGVRRGDLLDGVIAEVSAREVLVDVGLKTEAIVADKEMELMGDWLKTLKIGEKVTGYVVLAENDNGQIVVSLRRAGMDKKWQEMRDKMETGEEVSVRGIETNKGGVIVDIEGVRGFIPSSQLESPYSAEPATLIGKTVKAKIIEVDQALSKLIFSQRRQQDSSESRERVSSLKSKVNIGDNLEGEVTGIAAFGVFVKILIDKAENLFADGLVHISEIAWEKVDNVNDYFKVGQKVKVLVLGIDEVSGKLNLSVKQLLSDPWKAVAEKFSKDEVVKGKVTRVVNFGVFVNLAPGVDGLIHVSKLTGEMEFKTGDSVECVVESVDAPARKISLSVVPTVKPVGYR